MDSFPTKVVDFRCVRDDMIMHGAASITCLDGGRWSAEPPVCVEGKIMTVQYCHYLPRTIPGFQVTWTNPGCPHVVDPGIWARIRPRAKGGLWL